MSTVDQPGLGTSSESLASRARRAGLMFGPGPRRYRWTLDKYMKLAEGSFFREQRVELIQGEIIEISPVGTWHATNVALIVEILHTIFVPFDDVRVQQ